LLGPAKPNSNPTPNWWFYNMAQAGGSYNNPLKKFKYVFIYSLRGL
jgi:hypothetical protein